VWATGLTPSTIHHPTLVAGKVTPPFRDRVGLTSLNGSRQQHHRSVEPQTEPTLSYMYVLAPAHRARSSETRFIILAHVCPISFIAWHPAPLDLHQGGEAPGHHRTGNVGETEPPTETMARSALRSFRHVRAQKGVSRPTFGAPLPHFTVFSRLFFQRITIVFLPAIASRCLQYGPVFCPTHRIAGTP
jgi:hypothetical protein